MFEIRVLAEFSAAHSLRGYKGRCEELHGHNWKVEVLVSAGKLNKLGMVVDFKELKDELDRIISRLDHRHLNNLSFFKKVNPTSENIAKYIFDALTERRLPFTVDKVTVWESDSCSASFFRGK